MPHQHHAKHHHVQAMNIEARNPDATVVQVVYETASKTFDGPIGGYSTLNAPAPAQTTQSSQKAQATPTTKDTPAPVQPSTSAQTQPSTSASSTPKAVQTTQQSTSQQPATQSLSPSTGAQPVSSSSSPSTRSQSSQSSPSSSDSVVPSPPSSSAIPTSNTPTPTSSFIAQSATSSASSTPTSVAAAQSNGGMSGGAKAGLAIGILLGIGALLALAFFCYRRKKKNVNEAYEKHDDEKAQSSFANEGGLVGVNRAPSARSARGTSTAPQLSLRPHTEFSSDLAAQKARINPLATAGNPARAPANNPANPFGNHAEMSEKSVPSTQPASPTNPFGNHAEAEAPPAQVPAPLRVRTPTPDGPAAAGAGAGAGAGIAAAAAGNGRQNAPKPLNLSPNRPTTNGSERPMPSPAGTEFSMNSVSTAAANGPPATNVHRIQLDFKPSMEDELELRAGQLVRLLHEYDDGWVGIHP